MLAKRKAQKHLESLEGQMEPLHFSFKIFFISFLITRIVYVASGTETYAVRVKVLLILPFGKNHCWWVAMYFSTFVSRHNKNEILFVYSVNTEHLLCARCYSRCWECRNEAKR